MRKAICLGSVVPQWGLEQRIALVKEAGFEGFESHHPASEDEAGKVWVGRPQPHGWHSLAPSSLRPRP